MVVCCGGLSMGTARDWMEVLLSGALWGMLFLYVSDRKSSNIKPTLSLLSTSFYAFAGLLFGLWSTFRWKAFRWPLILVTVSALVGFAVAGRLYRRASTSRPTP